MEQENIEMGSLNKVQLIGNLGQDPETKYLPSGDAVTNLSIATTDKWKDKQSGEPKESTQWHRVSFFGRRAEVIAEFLQKGDPIYVEGSLSYRTYEKDGVTHYATDIRGRDFQFLSRKDDGRERAPSPRGQNAAESEDQSAAAPTSDQELQDDIPF
jgi:single-strand DNA-binding protein